MADSLAALLLEVDLLAAELALEEDLVARGIMPAGARRQPLDHELAAGVRFAELDRIVNDAAGLLARKAERVREHVLDNLAIALAGIDPSTDPYAALEELDRLTNPATPDTIPGLRDVLDEVTGELEEDLVATARAGYAEALEEARRQGIPDQLLPDVDELDDAATRAAAKAHAARVAKHPAERVLNVAAEAGGRAATTAGATGATVLEGALDAAEQASRAGTEDLARQAANVTHGIGRADAQRRLPAPASVYASELLDANTCGPCATVDGRTYASLEDGLVDYPGAGGFVACDGGARCRGTLVLVHGTEAGPTLDNPGAGPGSPGGPADTTPRGPASNAPAPATGPEVDPSTLSTVALTEGLDDVGRTVIPLDQLEEPVTTVAPAAVDRDPELATYSNDELDRVMGDPNETPERQLAAADEYDRRQAGEVEQVWEEEQLDAATLARYEEEREAWLAAGGDAAEALAGSIIQVADKGGRAIDRVKVAWTEHLEQLHNSAEDATNGYLVRRDRLAEFRRKYPSANGGGDTALLFEGPSRVAYYYASPELREYWDTLPHGRETFAEFALRNGISDRKTRDRARAAAEAREDARLRADESASGREKRARQRAEKRRRALPLSAGERLARDQARRDRIRAAERKRDAELRRLADDPEET